MVWFKYAQAKTSISNLAGHAHAIVYLIPTLDTCVCSANNLTYLMNIAKINLSSGDAFSVVDEVGSGQRAAWEFLLDLMTMCNALPAERMSRSCAAETALLNANFSSSGTLVP